MYAFTFSTGPLGPLKEGFTNLPSQWYCSGVFFLLKTCRGNCRGKSMRQDCLQYSQSQHVYLQAFKCILLLVKPQPKAQQQPEPCSGKRSAAPEPCSGKPSAAAAPQTILGWTPQEEAMPIPRGDVSSVLVRDPPPPPPPFPPGPLSCQGSIATGHTYGGAEGARKFFFSLPLPILSTLHPNTILEPNLDSNVQPILLLTRPPNLTLDPKQD